jgi:hypothetical protein
VKITHQSPLGPLLVPVLGRDVAAGEVVDVPKSIADPLLEQSDLWQAVTEKKEA